MTPSLVGIAETRLLADTTMTPRALAGTPASQLVLTDTTALLTDTTAPRPLTVTPTTLQLLPDITEPQPLAGTAGPPDTTMPTALTGTVAEIGITLT